MSERIANRAVCARCRSSLEAPCNCPACGERYPAIAGVRVLLPDPSAHLQHWRRQLGLIIAQGHETARVLQSEAAAADLGATRTRLVALAGAIAEQIADIAVAVSPGLGDPLPPAEGVGLPRGAADYLNCLFRDWGWSSVNDEENARSLAAMKRVAGGRALGRTLVLGAGGCRLAYDLHLQCGGTETAAVDVDPYLLLAAEAIVRGGSVPLTETSVNAPEVEPVSRRWTLTAPSGPLDAQAFQLYLADGTAPPFADGTFDTVVTPWFIDQVPTDLEGLLRRLHLLLVPGGRWLNHGPLLYRPDALPIARWYAREELFELAANAGFEVRAWESASQPHFVSPLTGRGLIENVLTFEAGRTP